MYLQYSVENKRNVLYFYYFCHRSRVNLAANYTYWTQKHKSSFNSVQNI